METRLYRIKVFKEKTPYFWVAYDLTKFIDKKCVQIFINDIVNNFI